MIFLAIFLQTWDSPEKRRGELGDTTRRQNDTRHNGTEHNDSQHNIIQCPHAVCR